MGLEIEDEIINLVNDQLIDAYELNKEMLSDIISVDYINKRKKDDDLFFCDEEIVYRPPKRGVPYVDPERDPLEDYFEFLAEDSLCDSVDENDYHPENKEYDYLLDYD